MSSDEKILADI